MNLLRGLLFVLYHPLNRARPVQTLFRVIWWKVNQLFFKLPAIITLTDSIRCICYPSSSYGSLIVYTKFPEYLEMRHVLNTLKKDDVFVDVGAGLGDYSLLAASKITTGKIYSFEPHPEAFKLLSENMQLNNLEKILKPYNSAVTNKNGVVRFVAHEVSELSRISSRANDESTISVSATTLDTFCEQNTINNIDVLKVDVEGAERSVFLGAKNMLKQGRIKQIIFELNTNPSRFNDESRFQTLEYLEKNSFRFYSFENQNATYTKKNILDIKTTQNILARLV